MFASLESLVKFKFKSQVFLILIPQNLILLNLTPKFVSLLVQLPSFNFVQRVKALRKVELQSHSPRTEVTKILNRENINVFYPYFFITYT